MDPIFRYFRSSGMNDRRIILVLVLLLLATGRNSAQRLPFDDGWLFHYGDAENAHQKTCNDIDWRQVRLPHDWSIEDIPGSESPFSPDAVSGMAGGFTRGGTSWYRKSFRIPGSFHEKRVLIYFEGVYMNSDIWINGLHLGNHPYGYTSFWYDLTGGLVFGEENTIAVRVRNEGRNSRWYSGSGIYRHVWLIVLDPVHVEPWNLFVTTDLTDSRAADVMVSAMIRNDRHQSEEVRVVISIVTENSSEVNHDETVLNLPAQTGIMHSVKLQVRDPELWSVNNPVLYKVIISLYRGDTLVFENDTNFGIRTLGFSVSKGFLLNNRSIKLRGGCIHHDNGLLGSVADDRAEERKVELLKLNGFNAVRCAHNPPSEKFLEACDRLGMLVIDEAFDMWQKPKNPDDYHLWFDASWEKDLTSMILRDRNHPSVIMWSMGNEIEERADSSGIEIMKRFRKLIARLDPTRPVTLAVNEFWDHPGRPWDQTAPAFAQTDIGGYNYQWWQYEPDHVKYPERIMMGSESVPVHAFQNWQLVEKLPWVIGDFVWTALDYLGEAGIGHTGCEGESGGQLMPYPWFNAWCGDIDLTGAKKPQSYYRDVVWRRSNLEMAVHAPLPTDCKETVSYWGWPDERQSWTWPGHEGETMKVNLYSRCSEVRLELNGRLAGIRNVTDSTFLTASFDVPYEPGVLTATGYINGKQVATVSFVTTGKAQAIKLKSDRQSILGNTNDLVYVTAELTDNEGRIVQEDGREVRFSLDGPGTIVASGNANPIGPVSFTKPVTATFRGRCMAILRPDTSTGTMTLRASSPGLPMASVNIRVIDENMYDTIRQQPQSDKISLLIIGDSNTERGDITLPLKMMLDSIFGNKGTGYCTLNTNSTGQMPQQLSIVVDSSWTMNDMRDGWTPGTPPYLAPDGLSISSSVRNAAVRIQFSGTGADLFYLDGKAKGSFKVTIDGKKRAKIKGSISVPETARASFGTLPSGNHQMDIRIKSGTVTLFGLNVHTVFPYRQPGAVVHKWANSWASTEEFARIDSMVFGSALRELDPSTVVIMLGTNDHNLDQRDPVSVMNNLVLIVRRIQAALPSARIMILSTVNSDKSDEQGLLPLYLTVSFPEAAHKCGVEYWDMNEWFGPCTAEKLPDGVHVSGKWGRLLAERLLNRLRN